MVDELIDPIYESIAENPISLQNFLLPTESYNLFPLHDIKAILTISLNSNTNIMNHR